MCPFYTLSTCPSNGLCTGLHLIKQYWKLALWNHVYCVQGHRYGFWAPWTAYSLGPSCPPEPGSRSDHVPGESPSVEIAIAFSAEPWTRASNLGPGPRRSGPSPARVWLLNRITSPEPVLFFFLLPNHIILFQLLKLFSFVCNGKVIIFRFSFL